MDGLSVYDTKIGIDWKWQDIDGTITKAPLRGKSCKSGAKQSIVVDRKGVPLGIIVDTANRRDMKMTRAILQSIVVYRYSKTIN